MTYVKSTVDSPKDQFEVRNDLFSSINETITARQIIKEMQPEAALFVHVK